MIWATSGREYEGEGKKICLFGDHTHTHTHTSVYDEKDDDNGPALSVLTSFHRPYYHHIVYTDTRTEYIIIYWRGVVAI